MISHHHACIFVHIPKCAGQSIEHVFLEDVGLDWDRRDPLLLRRNRNRALGPPRLGHLTAGDYTGLGWIPRSMFDSYFKFAVVRDPFARAVSLYRYTCPGGSFADFAASLSTSRRDHFFFRPQTDYVEIDGRIAMDQVIRMEELKAGFETVRARLGLGPELRHVNASGPAEDREDEGGLRRLLPWTGRRKKRVNTDDFGTWQAFYHAPGAADAIRRAYARDFEVLDYSSVTPDLAEAGAK